MAQNLTLLCRQGPEGRPPDVSPAREGWVVYQHEPERRRRGTYMLFFANLRFDT
jgi:hypothetical protein